MNLQTLKFNENNMFKRLHHFIDEQTALIAVLLINLDYNRHLSDPGGIDLFFM